ncbi:hypothetical protein C5167_024147 [Papaver somniferum]|uniref:Uncharacterized protein n=1 Tax=Papaver somniferum TaxID=3469 RepID=A0A4Y7JQS8_PAPSO|nr:hypothetical protein C5167_024147 [Papaver somniferum]
MFLIIAKSPLSSDSPNGEVSSKKNGNRETVKGSDTTTDSCDENGNNKMYEENYDDGEDAASQTSNTKKRARLDNDDVMEMAKGLHEKLNVFFEKIKESGGNSGIEFTNKEINFMSNTLLSHANAFKDEIVPGGRVGI